MTDSGRKERYCMTCCRETVSGACSFCNSQVAKYSSSANHHLLPGTLLRYGDYMLGRVLGSGGFGVTYLAVDIQLGMRLAIKELLPVSIATRVSDGLTVAPISEGVKGIYRSSIEGFLKEARTLVPFNEHPNIVSIVSFFEENGTAYLVMPYLEGQTLNEYLNNQGGRLDEEEALCITQCVLDALRATHKKNLLHRDVKPHNVYLTTSGPIKLIDFGSARQVVVEQSKSMSAVVMDGYAPFEQYQSRGKQGPWTDLYAVGALLYRMLTGENPPTATDRVFDDDIMSLQEIASFGVNHQVCWAVLKALAVKPEDRFQSVDELEAAIRTELDTPLLSPSEQAPHQNESVESEMGDISLVRRSPGVDVAHVQKRKGDSGPVEATGNLTITSEDDERSLKAGGISEQSGVAKTRIAEKQDNTDICPPTPISENELSSLEDLVNAAQIFHNEHKNYRKALEYYRRIRKEHPTSGQEEWAKQQIQALKKEVRCAIINKEYDQEDSYLPEETKTETAGADINLKTESLGTDEIWSNEDEVSLVEELYTNAHNLQLSREYRMSLVVYREIIARFPDSEFALLAREHMKEMKEEIRKVIVDPDNRMER